MKTKTNELKQLKIPNNSDIEAGKIEFDKIDWKVLPIKSIPKKLPFPYNNILPIIGSTPAIRKLYRARTLSSFGSSDPLGLVKSFSYPPKSKIKWLGRANLKSDSVFYCALNLLTAIVETDPSEKVHFIGRWSLENNVIENTALYTETVTHPELVEFKEKVIKSAFPQLGKEEIDHLKNYSKILEYEYLKTVSHENNYEYKYSAFWSNLLLNDPTQMINAIIYPSVNIQNNVNLAIKTEFVDRSMRLEKVFMVTHEKCEQIVKRMLLGVGKVSGKEVKWTSPNKEDHLDFLKNDHIGMHVDI